MSEIVVICGNKTQVLGRIEAMDLSPGSYRTLRRGEFSVLRAEDLDEAHEFTTMSDTTYCILLEIQ